MRISCEDSCYSSTARATYTAPTTRCRICARRPVNQRARSAASSACSRCCASKSRPTILPACSTPRQDVPRQIYAEYKANRSPMPDDLTLQIAPIHEVVAALGWPILESVEITVRRPRSRACRARILSHRRLDTPDLEDRPPSAATTSGSARSAASVVGMGDRLALYSA